MLDLPTSVRKNGRDKTISKRWFSPTHNSAIFTIDSSLYVSAIPLQYKLPTKGKHITSVLCFRDNGHISWQFFYLSATKAHSTDSLRCAISTTADEIVVLVPAACVF